MTGGFYSKLAADGIRKNRRIYFPYILMCVSLVAMYYIITFLRITDTISAIRVPTVRLTLNLGGWVLAVFSCVFLFYANSFLLRSRKKEFGLYNIFGMDKQNIGKVLQWETGIVALISIGAGLVFGIACSKFAELGLLKIIGAESNYKLTIKPQAIFMTIAIYTAVFILQLFNAQRQIRSSSAIALLRGENTGERPPKANVTLGLTGVVLLAAGYFIAVTANPASARKLLTVGFVAVLFIVMGTFITMIAGSVLLCRILQNSKSFYYKPSHFVSVSSMAFRMKRNGAGLASICILITMVLVMISSTACLLYGERVKFNRDHPREFTLDFTSPDPEVLSGSTLLELNSELTAVLKERGVVPENSYAYRLANVGGLGEAWNLYFIPLEDYNSAAGTQLALGAGEAFVFTFGNDFEDGAISVKGMEWAVKDSVEDFPYAGLDAMVVSESTIAVIIPNYDEMTRTLASLPEFGETVFASFDWVVNFDTGLTPEEQLALYSDIRAPMDELSWEYGFMGLNSSAREERSHGEFGLYGGIFFLGVILSIVFVAAAILIIYYKQLTEGFEDRPRFETMRKIGMTKPEIRKSINSQMLTVFFFPLLLAILHLAFAFPMIQRLLLVFNLSNKPLFLHVAITVGALVAVLYAAVYRVTSSTYYKLVSGTKKE